MDSILVALITGELSLVGVIITNNRNVAAMDAKLDKQQAVMETKIQALDEKVSKHNNWRKI